MTCSKCGSDNPPSSSYCNGCGRRLEPPPSEPTDSPRFGRRRSRQPASGPRRIPNREQARTASITARKVWRQVRRVGRWGFGVAFLTASVFTIWGNVNRIPFLSNFDIPPISEVFGGDTKQNDGSTSTSAVSTEGGVVSVPAEPGSLAGLVDRVEVSTGSADPDSFFDGDRATGWLACADCEDPFGVGESITVVFSGPVRLSELAIVNGLDGVGGRLPVLEVEMTADGGESFPLRLGDSVQLWRFDDQRLGVTTSRLKFVITGVVRVDETVASAGIAEFEIIGVPAEG